MVGFLHSGFSDTIRRLLSVYLVPIDFHCKAQKHITIDKLHSFNTSLDEVDVNKLGLCPNLVFVQLISWPNFCIYSMDVLLCCCQHGILYKENRACNIDSFFKHSLENKLLIECQKKSRFPLLHLVESFEIE